MLDMDKYTELVARTSFRILCDSSDSEYVTKAVFDALKRNGGKFGKMTPAEWLLSRSVSLCRRRHRHNIFMSFWGRYPELFVQAAPKVDDADDYITTQAWEIYCRASGELSLDQRVVYVLREMEGLSEEQVMRITGFWRGAVRLALETARKNIKYELSKFGKVAQYDAYIGFLRRVHYICGPEPEIP